MTKPRELHVHLLPHLAPPEALRGGLAVVIDVLRASTTLVQAFASGCQAVYPVAETEDARSLAARLPGRKVLTAGERHGQRIRGFDLGNSPREFTAEVCKGASIVYTTTNGTRALLHVAPAERILIAAFTNFSAVCGQIANQPRPVHLCCAGTDGQITLEDTLLAGAFVECFLDLELELNDAARLAWDCYEFHSAVVLEALRCSHGGCQLQALGYEEDLRAAAQIDRHLLVPELRRDPLRLEVGSVGVVRRRWPKGEK
jgi:2-phosphosulfolactate phosphatase